MRKRRRLQDSPIAGYIRKRSTELATAAVRATNDPIGEWAKKIRLDGKPFSFKDHEFLRALYDDPARHVVLIKAAQVGGTVWALLRSFHACLNGLTTLYLFPTKTDVLDFSRGRVAPLLEDNPFLNDRVLNTDTVGQKKIGDAFLYFRGMQSAVGLKSVPADQVVFDELDEATPDARKLALERMSHSDFRRTLELSNPSLPGYGIDESYQLSDQRHWTIKCDRCGHWTCLDKEFPRKPNEEVRIILPGDDDFYYRACAKCSKPLDLSKGEWVADYPGREIHGYLISQLHSVRVDAGEILSEYRTTRHLNRFYNLKVGLTYADLERCVDVPTVLSCCRTEDRPNGFAVMGVDTGKQIHAVIMITNDYSRWPGHIVALEVCSSFGELRQLMRQYRVNFTVIDGMPETHATRDLARSQPSSRPVYLCFFNENQRGSAAWDRDDLKVTINRTEALDASRAVIREKRVTLPERGTRNLELFAQHMASDAKVLQEDEETGAKKYKYVRTGEDHFSLAFTYALMAHEKLSIPMSPEAWDHFVRTVTP